MKVVIPVSAKRYMNLQCNDDIKKYTDCPEVQPLDRIFKQLKPKNVLELGAGLGRVSVYLRYVYGWDDTHFWLLDGDSGERQIAHVQKEVSGEHFYNSIIAAREFCIANGLREPYLHMLNAEDNDWLDHIPEIDLVCSFKAMGFHWPLGHHLELIYPKLAPGALLTFEIRRFEKECFVQFNCKQIADIDTDKYELLEVYTELKDTATLVLMRK